MENKEILIAMLSRLALSEACGHFLHIRLWADLSDAQGFCVVGVLSALSARALLAE